MPDLTDAPAEAWSGFADANDRAAARPGKLAKVAVIADYLRRVPPGRLADAVHFIGGRVFPVGDARTTGVSSAAVGDVVREMFDVSPDDWHARGVSAGEAGEAMARLWQEAAPAAEGEPLTLGDLREVFDTLASVTRPDPKRQILADLFSRIRTPREAAYVGKVLFGDLRTGVREGVLQQAVAGAFGRELVDVRRALLLRGDLGEVAELARDGRLGEARLRLFRPPAFMLASPSETAADLAAVVVKSGTGPWLAEHKLDGIRAQGHKTGTGPLARVEVYSRTGDRVDGAFPEVVEALRTLPGGWLLDGEIVPMWDGQVLPFAALQRRLGRKSPSPSDLAATPCVFVAFDLLHRDGADLLDEPLRVRRIGAEDLVSMGRGVLLSQAVEVADASQVQAAFDAARVGRNEGLVVKDPGSIYLPGRRGRAWLKLKTHLPTLDVVVTAAEHGHGKRRNHLSDYTFGVWDRDPSEADARLVNIGKAFSGVTDAEIQELTDHFLATATGRSGRVYQVKPTIVFEVAFDAIQKSKRHAGGFALRFPRIKRIRRDKLPRDADRLERVADLWRHDQNFNRADDPPPPPEPQLTLFG